MKKSIVLFVMLFVSSSIFAQTQNHDLELSASGSFGSYSYSYRSDSYSHDYEAHTYITTSIRAGYFFYSSFQIEPEVLISYSEKNAPLYNINANLTYNVEIPESKIQPFVLIGYGLGNSFPLLPIADSFIRMKEALDIGCINAGAGIKVFVSPDIAIRTEYRYQRYNDKTEVNNTVYSYDYHTIINIHKVLFGLSFFL